MEKLIVLNPLIPIRFKLSFPLKILWFFIFILIISLLISCVHQLNIYTKEFYLIKEEETKLSQLIKENKALEVLFSNSNSLANIGNYLDAQNFEKVGRVDYIQLLEDTVLAK